MAFPICSSSMKIKVHKIQKLGDKTVILLTAVFLPNSIELLYIVSESVRWKSNLHVGGLLVVLGARAAVIIGLVTTNVPSSLPVMVVSLRVIGSTGVVRA